MNDFDYSIGAKNILNKFHRVEKIVYVEGDDDIAFWEYLFELFTDLSIEIVPAGGRPNLQKNAELIRTEEAEYLVAMDSDYDLFKGFDHHPNILRTYGYAIENTLISTKSICKILKNITRLPNKNMPVDLCNDWFESLTKKIRLFVLSDLVSNLEGNGVRVLPNGSDRFMASKQSCEICEDKITEYLDGLPIDITEDRMQKEEALLLQSGLSYFDILKGHFLFSAVINFLKVQAKKLNKQVVISSGMFYSNLISVFEGLFNEAHPHFEYYKSSLSLIEIK